AATITDNYWIKPFDSELSYSNVRFTDDYFSRLVSRLALKGGYASFNRTANLNQIQTPELTNTGSFEKCWKLIDGKWWMYKTANHEEMFSELFIYHLGKKLGMNMAVYERGDKCVKSLDFTDSASVNFEPAFTFMGDNEDYEDVFARLNELCPQASADFVKMIFLDTLTANPDRHTANFGLLRDIKTGKLIGFAPVFDHNMALIARGYPKTVSKNDILICLFNDFINNHTEFKKYLPIVTEDVLKSVLATVNMKVRSKDIIEFLMKRYALIQKN
ncbi:MAG: HipA domain-containing protein, partial [Clostridia bacterium]|nr:HipA domain-containing protein [Clostridia bacterium]